MKIAWIALLLVMTAAGLVFPAEPAATSADPGHVTMALVNMKSLFSADDEANLAKNLQRHVYFIEKAAVAGADFVGFPEMSLSGYKCTKTMPFLQLDSPEVQALADQAAQHGVYVSAGLAEIDAAGSHWNTQIVIGPDGKLLGRHHKIWMTEERVFQEQPGQEHTVVEVKGLKVGIFICADGSDYLNIKALAEKGATVVYGSHANTTGSTSAGWYNFRRRFAGPFEGEMVEADTSNQVSRALVPSSGWCDQLNIYAAMHNQAAHYAPEYDPPAGPEPATKGWASGAWFLGPGGETLAQMPSSTDRNASREYMLICKIPLRAPVKEGQLENAP